MIYSADEESIQLAVEQLKLGHCIGFPTETVYGLAGDGLNEAAIAQVFDIKQRPSFDPLIFHISEQQDLYVLASEVPDDARKLIDAFWPGPMTLILPKQPDIPDLATSGLPTVAIRCPEHEVAQKVLTLFGGPIVAPSANRFGRISPTTAHAVREELGERLEFILDGGPCGRGIESTIIDCSSDSPKIARLGSLAKEDVEKIVGPVEIVSSNGPPSAPGMLKSHYAPKTTMYLAKDPFQSQMLATSNHVYIVLKNTGIPHQNVLELSGGEDLMEAARRLFALMREADVRKCQSIIAFPVPEDGLGRAINDRLVKAASGSVQWRNASWVLSRS
ncbi:MAG: L-threonylcarbamoyladenylate synthase [Verrucomicrobiota bacterium]